MAHPVVSTIATWLVVAASAVTPAASLTVSDAWIPEAPPGVRVWAGYLTITNASAKPVALEGVRSPDFGRVEMHRTVIKDGMADMEEMTRGVVPGHGKLVFARGGNHFMLYDPKQPLHVGSQVRLHLLFSDKRRLSVTVPVKDGSTVYHHPH